METIYDHNFKKEEIPEDTVCLSAIARGAIDVNDFSEEMNLFFIALLYLVRENDKKMDEYERKIKEIDPTLALQFHQIRYPDRLL